jgi:calcium/calmodulin-dependent protein kinase (CaM kinase) II
MPATAEEELLELSRQLLDSITLADWKAYAEMCDDSISCFEPEAVGHLVEGMDFHRYYFDLGAGEGPRNTTLVAPKVRLMGDVAVVTYVRLTQRINEADAPTTSAFEETRVWQKQEGGWKHVHFHRSPCR